MRLPTASIDGHAGGDRAGCRARMPPLSSSSVPQSGLPPRRFGSAAVAMTTAPATLAKPMIAPWLRSIPMMMMTKVWPIATAKSGQTLESWLLMLRAVTRSGKNTAIDDEIGEGQIEDEVLRDEQAAQKPHGAGVRATRAGFRDAQSAAAGGPAP